MHLRLERLKSRVLLLTIVYRIIRPLFSLCSAKFRFRLYLDLEWIFGRLAHEESFRFYRKKKHPLLGNTVAYLLERLKPGQVLLDLGCGHGDISFLLAKAGYEVVGIDHTVEHVAAAKRNYQLPRLKFECQDAKDYLSKNKVKFDVLILSHILEHLDSPADFLQKFSHFFNYVFIEVPDFDASYLNMYRSAVGSKLLYSDSDHVIEFDREELLRTVQQAGLEIIHQEYRFGVLRLWCVQPHRG